jgi:hypothetical protein
VRPVARRLVGAVPASIRRHLPSELRTELRSHFGWWVPGDVGFELEPPLPMAGERTGPPDFAALGTAVSGVDWWMACIADHPEVAPNRTLVGAAHTFAAGGTDGFGSAEVARFHALFPRRPGRIIGHWAPDGLSYPWVAPLLATAAPRARLLLLVRDPVERLRADLERKAATRAPHVGSDLADAVDRGFYASQLTRLLTWFPKDQVQVLQFERCVADPMAALAQTFAFLGIDDTYRPRPLALPAVLTGPVRDPLASATRRRLVDLYATDVVALADLVPHLELSLWPNFAART